MILHIYDLMREYKLEACRWNGRELYLCWANGEYKIHSEMKAE